MNDCLFCKIIAGEIPSTKVYEDEYVFAFRDINPQAPVHILVLPKQHICCADEINADNSALVAKCFEAIAKIAKARDSTTATVSSIIAASTAARPSSTCISTSSAAKSSARLWCKN